MCSPHQKCLVVSLIPNKQYGMHVPLTQTKQLGMRLHRSEIDVQEIRKFGLVPIFSLHVMPPITAQAQPQNSRLPPKE